MKLFGPSLFLLLLLAVCVSCTTYYVSPFGDDNNSGLSQSSPLKTLQKATSVARYNQLLLMTGIYSGPGNVGISLDYPTPLTAQPNVVVTCRGSAASYAFTITPSTNTWSFSGFTIQDCPTAITVTNSGSSTVTLKTNGMIFKNNTVHVEPVHSVVSIINSTFVGGSYGVLQTKSVNGALSIVNSTFSQINQNAVFAQNCPSAISIAGTSFRDSLSSALYISCPLNVDDILVSNVYASSGAAILVNGTQKVIIKNSRFENNFASGAGGVINSGSSSSLTISGSVFDQNSALKGGAVYFQGPMSVTSTVFSGNQASAAGGGFFCSNSQSILNNVTFSNNVSPSGSAFFCSGCISYDTAVTFENNEASCNIVNQGSVNLI